MRIESEIKLDFSDVLIKPKRLTLGSRKEVDLNRFYEFRNALDNASFMGVPIMASNMDGVGTFEMADALIEQKLFTCLVKTYSAQELIEYFTRLTKQNCPSMINLTYFLFSYKNCKILLIFLNI